MKFFGRETRIGRLEIDLEATNCDSEAVQKRMTRISDNYQKLEFVLKDLETMITENDYLAAKKLEEAAACLAAEQAELEQSVESANPKKPR